MKPEVGPGEGSRGLSPDPPLPDSWAECSHLKGVSAPEWVPRGQGPCVLWLLRHSLLQPRWPPSVPCHRAGQREEVNAEKIFRGPSL